MKAPMKKGMSDGGGRQPMKPTEKLTKVKAGAPTKGSGSDTSPYSSARKKGGR